MEFQLHSFKPKILNSLISHDIANALAVIHETKGKQKLYEQQKPEVLKNLQHIASIESTESSNRLEGATAPQSVLDKIIQSGKPLNAANRSEAEIAGYRNVLAQLHSTAADIPLSTNNILQIHRDLMSFTPEGGGYWKKTSNDITMTMPDGKSIIRSVTTPPYLVETQMHLLVPHYQEWLD